MRVRWAISVVLAAAACGDDGGALDDARPPDDSDGMMGSDAGDGYKMLIERSWTLGSGLEKFYCRRQTITEDLYITGMRPLSPNGTHHEFLTIVDDSKLGNYECDRVNDLPLGLSPMLFAGGIGTTDFEFPPGVAVKVPAGTTLQLYLHVYNSTDQTLTETSGILAKTVPASEVVHEADMMFVGKKTFKVPVPQTPGETYDLITGCGAPVDWHIAGMWPHMHDHGVHQKVEIQRALVTMKTPLDVAYDFNEQRNYSMDFMVPKNDYITVTCTWLNDTGAELSSGDSADNEMCYTGVFVWPKVGDLYTCLQ